MEPLDLAGALRHLMRRLGDAVVVSVGAIDPGSAPLVAQMSGTLRVVGDAYAEDLPSLAPAELPAVFGFEEHDSTFLVDVLAFRQARASDDHLELELGAVVIEVTAPLPAR
jgi:hypothetical protein